MKLLVLGKQDEVGVYPTLHKYVLVPHVGREDVFVVLTERLLHPVVLSTVNDAVGEGFTQIV